MSTRHKALWFWCLFLLAVFLCANLIPTKVGKAVTTGMPFAYYIRFTAVDPNRAVFDGGALLMNCIIAAIVIPSVALGMAAVRVRSMHRYQAGSSANEMANSGPHSPGFH